jgi:hypothetical protein
VHLMDKKQPALPGWGGLVGIQLTFNKPGAFLSVAPRVHELQHDDQAQLSNQSAVRCEMPPLLRSPGGATRSKRTWNPTRAAKSIYLLPALPDTAMVACCFAAASSTTDRDTEKL